MKNDFSLAAARARYETLRGQLAQAGWISEGYAQNRGPGAGGPCYQWTRKVRHKTVSAATLSPGSLCNWPASASSQTLGQDSFRSYLTAIRVSDHHRKADEDDEGNLPARRRIELILQRERLDRDGLRHPRIRRALWRLQKIPP